MKTISCFLFGLLCCFSTIYAQKVLTVDLDDIKQKTSNAASAFYYPTLITRFAKGDTLTDEELRCVYYGAALKENKEGGTGRSHAKLAAKFEKYCNEEQCSKAAPLGMMLLEEEPVDIRLSFMTMICCERAGMNDSARLLARRYYGLLRAITSSGDGISPGTAMVVTRVPDEYDILREAKFTSVGQALMMEETGNTDKLILDTESQLQEHKIPALYFNVEISFLSMRKLMEGNMKLRDILKDEK